MVDHCKKEHRSHTHKHTETGIACTRPAPTQVQTPPLRGLSRQEVPYLVELLAFGEGMSVFLGRVTPGIEITWPGSS